MREAGVGGDGWRGENRECCWTSGARINASRLLARRRSASLRRQPDPQSSRRFRRQRHPRSTTARCHSPGTRVHSERPPQRSPIDSNTGQTPAAKHHSLPLGESLATTVSATRHGWRGIVRYRSITRQPSHRSNRRSLRNRLLVSFVTVCSISLALLLTKGSANPVFVL